MKIKIITAFTLWDAVFNILIPTDSILAQTVNFAFIVVVVSVALFDPNKVTEKKWAMIQWANISYWLTMLIMYLYAFITISDFTEWMRFNTNHMLFYIFYSIAFIIFCATWFLWGAKKWTK